MGILTYGSPGIDIAFDDRALTHLQIVITAKLRRRESFLFSWIDPARGGGGGRSSIWLDPSSTLYYQFLEVRVPPVNRAWYEQLMESANGNGGLFLCAEPTRVEQDSRALALGRV